VPGYDRIVPPGRADRRVPEIRHLNGHRKRSLCFSEIFYDGAKIERLVRERSKKWLIHLDVDLRTLQICNLHLGDRETMIRPEHFI
jgi:hypothetical protein